MVRYAKLPYFANFWSHFAVFGLETSEKYNLRRTYKEVVMIINPVERTEPIVVKTGVLYSFFFYLAIAGYCRYDLDVRADFFTDAISSLFLITRSRGRVESVAAVTSDVAGAGTRSCCCVDVAATRTNIELASRRARHCPPAHLGCNSTAHAPASRRRRHIGFW